MSDITTFTRIKYEFCLAFYASRSVIGYDTPREIYFLEQLPSDAPILS
jgi:hypothetical protein